MRRITDSYIKKHLKRATESLRPDKASQIWEQPVKKAAGDEWYLDGTKSKKRSVGKVLGLTACAAACFVVCFLSFYMVNLRTEAMIYLDVNPSVMLRVNCNDQVIRAEAYNHDGEIILEDMDLKNTDLDVAVNAILGSMVKHGYISEAKEILLLSVDSSSSQKSEALRTQLAEEMNDCLTSLVGSGSIFDQDVKVDDSQEALADEYGITPGKAGLLQKVVDAHPELDYSLLAGLSMNDLVQYLKQAGIDLRDFANYTGISYDGVPDSKDVKPAGADTDQDREEQREEDDSQRDRDDIDDKDDSVYEKEENSDDDKSDRDAIDDDASEDDQDDDLGDDKDDASEDDKDDDSADDTDDD